MISYGICLYLACVIIPSCMHVAAGGIIQLFFVAEHNSIIHIGTASSLSTHLSMDFRLSPHLGYCE